MPKPARKTTNSGSAGCVRKYSASAPNAAEPVTASRRTNPDEQHEAYVHHDKVGERGAAHLAAFGVERISRNEATVISSQKKRNE